MKKVMVVIGTRPEAIKMAPVVFALDRHPNFDVKVCLTAQHREMLDQPLEFFGITADFDLNLMQPGQTLGGLTSRAIAQLDAVMDQALPDAVLVQGDTTTAFCGALSAFYHQVKVGHVEAGLRTGHKYAPYPEEINRRLVSPLADIHFAPTTLAKANLVREAIPENQIVVTGNTVIDALLWTREKIQSEVPKELPLQVVEGIADKKIVLVTGHRRENFNQGFKNICQAIRTTADRLQDVEFIYPVHLNPQVQEPVNATLSGHPRIHLIEPLSYAPFVWLMNHATVILTDSGGVQEEAPSLGKPVLVMREWTERPEGVDAGNARLVGTDVQKITEQLELLLENADEREKMAKVANPYGDGRAAEKIATALEQI
jgi:UDP-N-acetylglucosamine 2-epimerase